MTLPLAKLASLVIKTIAKPVANGIKRSVKTNPTLASMVAGPAQGNRDAYKNSLLFTYNFQHIINLMICEKQLKIYLKHISSVKEYLSSFTNKVIPLL